MWTRKELKEASKAALKRNYVATVLVGLVVAFCEGTLFTNLSTRYSAGYSFQDTSGQVEYNVTEPMGGVMGVILGLSFIFILLILIAAILLRIFALNPLDMSGRRFFLKNLNNEMDAKELGWAFKNDNYKNIVKTMLYRDAIVFLFTLLLVIPGIIKAYEYMMVPYILTEYPDMQPSEVLKKSSEMMYGNKWNAFVLSLSFIGWMFLSALTLGISGILFSNPYLYGAHAGLYDRLKAQV